MAVGCDNVGTGITVGGRWVLTWLVLSGIEGMRILM